MLLMSNKHEETQREHRNAYLAGRTPLPGEFLIVMETPRLENEGMCATIDSKTIRARVAQYSRGENTQHLNIRAIILKVDDSTKYFTSK